MASSGHSWCGPHFRQFFFPFPFDSSVKVFAVTLTRPLFVLFSIPIGVCVSATTYHNRLRQRETRNRQIGGATWFGTVKGAIRLVGRARLFLFREKRCTREIRRNVKLAVHTPKPWNEEKGK